MSAPTSRRYPPEFKERVRRFRRDGWSIKELAKEFCISVSTVHLWVLHVDVSPQGRQRLRQRVRDNALRYGSANLEGTCVYARLKAMRLRREAAFSAGLASVPTVLDAMCVGIYMGEGFKFKRAGGNASWGIANADPDILRPMRAWAIRAGQPPANFYARVQVHPEDSVSDAAVRDFWAQIGVVPEAISILKIRSPGSRRITKRRTPFGTCALYPRRNGVYLFAYMEGQQAALLRQFEHVPERLGDGLQSLLLGFESRRALRNTARLIRS